MLRSAFILPLLLVGCAQLDHSEIAPPSSTKTITFYDGSTIRAPTAFTLTEEVGDSPVVFGALRDRNSGFEISYQSGAVFGMPYDPADIHARKKAGDTILDRSHGASQGIRYNVVLARNSLGRQTLYISFPSAWTCFSASISTPSDIQHVKQIVLTFQPKPPNGA